MSTGLPRYSALPQPRSARNGSVDSGGSSGSTSLPNPGGRSSVMSNRRPESRSGASETPVSPQSSRRSMLMQPSLSKGTAAGRAARPQSMMAGLGGVTGLPRSPPAPPSDFPETVQEAESPTNGYGAGQLGARRTRPSLSDRTIESLAQVPPSPSPAKQRRQSTFSTTEPLHTVPQPQSRAGSSLGMRPPSRIGPPPSMTGLPSARPASPTKRPGTSGGLKQAMGVPAPRTARSTSGDSLVSPTNGTARPSSVYRKPGTGLQQPGAGRGLARPGTGSGPAKGLATPSAARTLPSRPAGSARSPAKELWGPEIQKTQPRTPASGIKSLRPPTAARPASMLQSNRAPGLKTPGARVLPKTRLSTKPAAAAAPTKTESSVPPSLASNSGDESSVTAPLEDQSPADEATSQDEELSIPEDITPRKASQSLRDMIAAGRAATKAAGSFTPRTATSETDDFASGIGISLGPDTDPNAMNLEDSRFINVLKKRVNTGRSDGKLNISALGLTELPSEVLGMYEYNADDNSISYYDMVDVTRLLAADNEIEELPDSAFPPLPTDDTSGPYSQPAFATLENIDFHGNKLRRLNPRLPALEKLTVLNLSRNHLGLDSFEIISKLPSLIELRVAENGLSGDLPACIGDLAQLETLDIHSNNITALPRELANLNKLRRLNVTDNRLDAIPFDAIFDLPLIEVLASRNRLNGALFASHVTQIPHLQILDVSTNALIDISEEKISLPQLHTFTAPNNRIAALPSVVDWKELINLNVEENKISAFPEGFCDLPKLKTANFSNNSLLTLDDKIGNMDNLATLKLTNNPIRERKFTRFGIEELKAELRLRLQPQAAESQDLASPTKGRFSLFLGGPNGGSVIGPGPAWTASGGVIEKSNSKLRDIESAQLESLVGQHVHTLSLHHNWLPQIPSTIGLLGASLTTLDLSNNRLNKTNPFVGGNGQPLHLPNLTTFNLTSNGLVSLEALTNGGFMAPLLTTLIVPFNRLTALPVSPISLRDAFPQMTKLMAANNVIETLDADAVKGLQVLDVSSNEIVALPPQLGNLQGTLRTLMVNGNRFRVPGWGVLEKGTEEILRWCKSKIPAGEEGSLVQEEPSF